MAGSGGVGPDERAVQLRVALFNFLQRGRQGPDLKTWLATAIPKTRHDGFLPLPFSNMIQGVAGLVPVVHYAQLQECSEHQSCRWVVTDRHRAARLVLPEICHVTPFHTFV